MKTEEIKQNLCYYDKRHPLYSGGDRKNDCYCDNCFYRRTPLAEELLKFIADKIGEKKN